MNQSITFSSGIHEYILMSLKIWPALQFSLQNIPESSTPPPQSPLPSHNYKIMSSDQFIQTIANDLLTFILQHDVKPQHIIDYLDDILFILNTDEQSNASVTYISHQLCALINELPEGNIQRLVNFRMIYNARKNQKIQYQVEGEWKEEEGSQEEEDEEDDHDMVDQEQQIMDKLDIKQTENAEKVVNIKQQQKLQDNGWIVVGKKRRK